MSIILKKLNFLKPLKCRLLSHFCDEVKPKYYIRIAFPEDYEKIMKFMYCTYAHTEPIIVNLGLGSQTVPAFLKYIRQNLCHGLTLFIEDLYTNDVIGAAVNVHSVASEIQDLSQIACCQEGMTRDLFNFLSYCSRVSNMWEIFGHQSLFMCRHLSIHPEHCCQGLAKRLIMDSWVLARDLDYKIFRIDCSSSYVAKIAEQFEWKCVSTTKYNEHVVNNEYVFRCVESPHTEMKIYAGELDYYRSYYPMCKN